MQNDTCYILALIKRDDGERLLLGSGFYEFTAGLKHFNPNLFANDVVELQGTDGQLLAGQVRRSTSQVFEGIIGDGTTSKQMVEQKRREFFLFFRKQHHYTVVYIMPDGTAIKRDRGYITEAPAVQELYQVQPKWRVALAFEDVNYYSYAEDSQGNEIYSFEAELGLANIEDGGLVWDADGATSDAYVHTGKNLFNKNTDVLNGNYYLPGNMSSTRIMTAISSTMARTLLVRLQEGQTYTIQKKASARFRFGFTTTDNPAPNTDGVITSRLAGADTASSVTFTVPNGSPYFVCNFFSDDQTADAQNGYDTIVNSIQIELGPTATTFEPYSQGFSTGGYIFAPSTGGGPIIVTVNGVDDANPVWHVYGPATNPTLTNSTTGEALTWNGTVPANQELIIDMGQQTATLEGANVFEFVSGSWVQLAPGQNRISYTAANTTRSSKVYWNEVVG